MTNIERTAGYYADEYAVDKQLNGEEMSSQDIKKAYMAGAKDMLANVCKWVTNNAQTRYLMTESDAEIMVYEMQRELK